LGGSHQTGSPVNRPGGWTQATKLDDVQSMCTTQPISEHIYERHRFHQADVGWVTWVGRSRSFWQVANWTPHM